VKRVCAALIKPNVIESPLCLPTVRLAAAVASTTPAATGMRALGPNTSRIPTEMPAAGQNAATLESGRRARPSRAARK
jgi:hypothetical protein